MADQLPGEDFKFFLDAVSRNSPTRANDHTIVNTGGRIMAVSAQAKTAEEALERANYMAGLVEFGENGNRVYYRGDIGAR
jgi:phosphoribosylamine-glycine ligase